MKTTFTKYLKSLAFAIVFLVAASAAYAWVAPTSQFPNGNVPSPVHTGSQDQVKQGGFDIQGNARFNGGNSLGNNTINYGNLGVVGAATFYSDVTIGSTQFNWDRNLFATGNISNQGNVQSDSLSYVAPGTGREPVCALEDGTLVLCDDSVQQGGGNGNPQIQEPPHGTITFSGVFGSPLQLGMTHQWQVPADVTVIEMETWGGGGGGGSQISGVLSGGGGGGGGVSRSFISVTPGETLTIEVGGGGQGGAQSGGPGTAGSPSRVLRNGTVLVYSNGGLPGNGAVEGYNPIGGAGGWGNYNTGLGGQPGVSCSGQTSASGGDSASSVDGIHGNGGFRDVNGTYYSPTRPGGGGVGACNTLSDPRPKTGAAGQVVFTW